VRVSKYLVTESILLRIYVSHIALVSSICEPSNCLEEERCGTLMEDDFCVDFNTIVGTN